MGEDGREVGGTWLFSITLINGGGGGGGWGSWSEQGYWGVVGELHHCKKKEKDNDC